MRFSDQGMIRAGAKADLILFDPTKVRARSTYLHPFAKAEGFDLVMLNGRPAFEQGSRAGNFWTLIAGQQVAGAS